MERRDSGSLIILTRKLKIQGIIIKLYTDSVSKILIDIQSNQVRLILSVMTKKKIISK